MTPAEQAILTALGAEAKAALKVMLKDFADNKIPALVAAEAAKLPTAYQGIVAMGFSGVYPSIQKALDAEIDSL